MATAATTTTPSATTVSNELEWRRFARYYSSDAAVSAGLVPSPGTGLQVSLTAGEATVRGVHGNWASTVLVDLATADPTLGRIDIVVVRLNTPTGSAHTLEIDVVTGTPAGSPSAPAATVDTTKVERVICEVSVAAAASSLVAADITQRLGHTWPGSGVVVCPATPGVFGSGTVWFDTTKNRLKIYDSDVSAWRIVGGELPAAFDHHAATTNIATGTPTNVPIRAVSGVNEHIDTDTFSFGTQGFKIPTGLGGRYLVEAWADWDTNTNAGLHFIWIHGSGWSTDEGPIADYGHATNRIAGSTDRQVRTSRTLLLPAGAEVYCRVSQATGATVDVTEGSLSLQMLTHIPDLT